MKESEIHYNIILFIDPVWRMYSCFLAAYDTSDYVSLELVFVILFLTQLKTPDSLVFILLLRFA